MYSSRVLPPLLHLWESGGQLRKVSPGAACVVVGRVGQTLAQNLQNGLAQGRNEGSDSKPETEWLCAVKAR